MTTYLARKYFTNIDKTPLLDYQSRLYEVEVDKLEKQEGIRDGGDPSEQGHMMMGST